MNSKQRRRARRTKGVAAPERVGTYKYSKDCACERCRPTGVPSPAPAPAPVAKPGPRRIVGLGRGFLFLLAMTGGLR